MLEGLVVEDNVEQGLVDTDTPVVFDEAELAEAVHKATDAGAGCADHLGEVFLLQSSPFWVIATA